MKKGIETCYQWVKKETPLTLDRLLEEISVACVDQLDNGINYDHMEGWYAVINTEGIIAYFGDESDALRFRLDYINQLLNSL